MDKGRRAGGEERERDEMRIRERVESLVEKIAETMPQSRMAVMYKSREDGPFHWSGYAKFPEEVLQMQNTLVHAAIAIGAESGIDEQEIRTMLSRMALGVCPGCGQPVEPGKRHVH